MIKQPKFMKYSENEVHTHFLIEICRQLRLCSHPYFVKRSGSKISDIQFADPDADPEL